MPSISNASKPMWRPMEREESALIPRRSIFPKRSGLSNELKQKLETATPRSIAEAQRIDGMTPAALAIIVRNQISSDIHRRGARVTIRSREKRASSRSMFHVKHWIAFLRFRSNSFATGRASINLAAPSTLRNSGSAIFSIAPSFSRLAPTATHWLDFGLGWRVSGRGAGVLLKESLGPGSIWLKATARRRLSCESTLGILKAPAHCACPAHR